MKRSIKRILCGTLALMMSGTLLVEHSLRLRLNAQSLGEVGANGATTQTTDVSFENVTGQYDTTALREQYLNNSVLKSDDVTPTYETRTVMVTLKGAPLADHAKGESVNSYLESWDGQRTLEKIVDEQNAFLRKLSKTDIEYKLERTYDTLLNAVAIEVNTKHVSAIKQMEGVESVVITTSYSTPDTVATTSSTNVVTNETNVYATGIYDSSEFSEEYGAGTVVAILDTGLDYTHPAFQGFQTENPEIAWSEDYVEEMVATRNLVAETRSGTLKGSDVYVSAKVPYAYDYADDDPDVYPSYSNHGTHVAGIIGGYDTNGYADKDGNPIDETFKGVVPDAQLAIFKVFTDDLDDPDIGGAVAEDIIAALEDCVTLGVDVINMSLGTSCGFTTTNDGDDEGEMLNAVYARIQTAGITLCAAASNDYSSGYGGTFGTNLKSNPDSGTVGSPSTFASSLSVASINGQKASYMVANATDEANKAFVFYEESRDIDGNPFDFTGDLQKLYNKTEFEYVVVPGIGQAADYTSSIRKLFVDDSGNSLGRIALIKRGTTTFQEKVELAMDMGAAGVIVYNNVAGIIRMNLGEIDDPVPSVSINMNAGNSLVAAAGRSRLGTISISEEYKAGPFMSEFSSWGPTHDLKLKPEITAHGGEITSTVPGGYGEQSGTSMASPNMAGFMALVRNYIKKDLGVTDPVEINRLAMQLTMSTATTAYDQDGLPYSPRKQGAGVARLERVIGGTSAYLYTDVEENDYRPKIEIGDDPDRTGVYDLTFNVKNFGESDLEFSKDSLVMTESAAKDSNGDSLAVSEQAYMLDDNATQWTVNGKALSDSVFTVKAGESAEITVTVVLSNAEKDYIDAEFKNGMYVEGYLKLVSRTDGQCDLSIPFLGFYGNWEDAPMLDYTAFEVAESEQDASVLEEDKIQASIWATQPFSMYYNEKYILPMGGYVYLLPDDVDPMYVDEDHCSISRYNTYYGEGNAENYMTSTGIKAVYAGLLRNARVVKYRMYNVETGELILEDQCNRVGKAYTAGGSAVPANVELEIRPEEYGLVANGKYRMDFEFFMDTPAEGETAAEENTYSFSFTVDYEAPILEDARIRYYNYKDGNKEKQRIYLDVDIYDNHYAQAMMLCYPKVDSDGQTVLQLATDYPTPVRNANKNGTTTVTIEITNIYDYICNEYGNQLYLQIDDYSINSCLYRVQIGEANTDILPDNGAFELADGEDSITLDVYGTHKVALEYTGSANLSNFLWTSMNPTVADVKNGEIVGLKAGSTKIIVSNRKGDSKTINVTVTENVSTTMPNVPSISFGVIKNQYDALVKASGSVEVHAGKSIALNVIPEPWYHPMTDLKIEWSTSNAAVATVDQNGNVETLKKGTAIITAVLYKKSGDKWEQTLYSATVILRVQNEFTVSNYTLTDYNGVGGVVTIPTDMNIWYIGEEAFKDNDNITKIIIPESVVQINARAFINCSALEEVYFVSDTKNPIATSDLTLIYEQAFYNCQKLRKLDLSNVKTITIAEDCFGACPNLAEVVDMPSIGTMHHRAFAGTALTSVDLTGLHMSGDNVFEGCTKLTSVKTGKFTAIGDYMFKDCTNLRSKITISTPKIGEGAFSGCTNLTGVIFDSPAGETLSFDIGARAFENCGKNAKTNFTVDFGGEIIRSIGERAFAGSSLKELTAINGLKDLGANAFINTYLETIEIDDTFDLAALNLSGVPFGNITLTVAGGATKYTEENGVIYDKNKTAILFVNSSVSGAFALPATVEKIGAYAFAGSNVTSLTLTSNIDEIGEAAFENSKIASVAFNGANITSIPARAFYGASIASVTLPDTVTNVGDNAFAGSLLKTFEANGLVTLGSGVFEDCVALQTMALSDSIKTMGSRVFAGCTALVSVDLPSLEELGEMTFYGASNLTSVSFGANAKTTGEYTFMNTAVTSVSFKGNEITSIGEGAFYNASRLQTITLPTNVTSIGGFAFQDCRNLTEVNGIENVEYFGDQAFYNTALTTLKLTSAKHIGIGAFAAESYSDADVTASYTSIEMPVVESIGVYAFLNAGVERIDLPATLKTVGYGAFGSADDLTTITVDENNATFFVEENVLYREISEGVYELVCYPAARVVSAENGEYTVIDGTVRVDAYAFYGLNAGAVNKVVLPYSINAIGDSAFYDSGVTEYTFESIQAPVLESVYRAEIEATIEGMADSSTIAYYKGYFYSNFQTYLFDFTSYGGQTSNLVINYPENGVGYNNHIYTLYFGERNTIGILMADNTREAIDMIEAMPTADEIATWKEWATTDENFAKVKSFAEELKLARLYYNNASKDAAQFAFISEELTQKLTDVETAFRDVKAHFGLVSSIASLETDASSQHKTTYQEGETFSMDGLVVLIIYDDGSTEIADNSKLTLVNTGALSKWTRYVTLNYEGTSQVLRVEITVEAKQDSSSSAPSDSSSEEESSSSDSVADSVESGKKKKGCGGTISGVTTVVGIAAVGMAMLKRRKENDEE